MAIITITRGVQSGGRELARCLAERLGYRCLSREVISQCARKYNIMESDLYQKLVEAPSLWQRLTKEHRRYLIYIQCSLVEAAKTDNVIYHGYAGQMFLKGVRHALKVRLDAPLEDRIRAEMKEYGKDRAEAQTYIEKMDDQRRRWAQFLYGQDCNDTTLYDLSINFQNITIDTACGIVERVIASPEYRATEASTSGLSSLSLACEVRAAIAADDNLWNQDISVSASGQVVALQGSVRNAKVRDAIVAIASQVKGVTKCESHLSLLSGPLHTGGFGDH
jgi:cytidylate kinase